MANSAEVHLAGDVLNRGWHICAFFNNKHESYRILLPFIKEGFDQGNRAVHILGPSEREDFVLRLEQVGINVSDAEHSGQIAVRSWDDSCIRNGTFDAHQQTALVEELLAEGKARGFEFTRPIVRMEWAFQGLPAVNQIIEHETQLNQTLKKYSCVGCWTYDLSKFSASAIMDLLRTHPLVLIGEVLHRNAFFVPPEELLRERRERPNTGNADANAV